MSSAGAGMNAVVVRSKTATGNENTGCGTIAPAPLPPTGAQLASIHHGTVNLVNPLAPLDPCLPLTSAGRVGASPSTVASLAVLPPV